MKTYKKIDFYFLGDYFASTNQSKTCKEAKQKLLDRIDERKDWATLVERQIKKYPKELKARFSK